MLAVVPNGPLYGIGGGSGRDVQGQDGSGPDCGTEEEVVSDGQEKKVKQRAGRCSCPHDETQVGGGEDAFEPNDEADDRAVVEGGRGWSLAHASTHHARQRCPWRGCM
ncbi:hypothetical protein CPLU01_07170 [Colletotrichum plurivorum]|uniref:Uncharacterized protein n=1 Tax=Colletotrichum plurivorum TaxID=2175906 RepID=A0A8H6KG98_9PEZI|nr:hypothetical protein CPLU01_07170 [Colletotrichum plurivorum]